MGSETGYLRFDEPEASQKARAAAVLAKEGGLAVKNFIAILEPVTGKKHFFNFQLYFLPIFVMLELNGCLFILRCQAKLKRSIGLCFAAKIGLTRVAVEEGEFMFWFC